jgi:hypothetical protein
MSIDPKIKTRFIYEWRPHNTLYYIVRHIVTEDLTKQSQIYDNTGFIMHCKFSIVTGPNRRQVSIYISISRTRFELEIFMSVKSRNEK